MINKVQKDEISVFEAFLALKTVDEVQRFLKDICTPQEMQELQERWRVCQLLERGDLSYREIHSMTGVSLTTIGRVARFLKQEPYQGYRLVFDTLKKKGTK